MSGLIGATQRRDHDHAHAHAHAHAARPAQSRRQSQPRCACGGTIGPTGECDACRTRRASRSPAHAPPAAHGALARSPGRPLDSQTLSFMQRGFGHDFSQVRIHTDARAEASAAAVDALAFTVGREIFFRPEHYQPATGSGRRLIAHELAHVVQQTGGGAIGALPGADHATPAAGVRLSRIDRPMLNRQQPPYPGAIARCRGMGVPCPAPHFHHGTVCRLTSCSRSRTAGLPYAISPGVCIYHCLDNRVCACVLLGSSTSAICVLTICDSPGQASLDPDDGEAIAQRALAQAAPTLAAADRAQAFPRIGQRGDIYEQEAERAAARVADGDGLTRRVGP